MDSRQQQALYLSVLLAATLVVILPYWIVSINFWWPNIHLPLPWIVRMATAPIVLLPIAAVGAWGGSKYRKSGGFEQPYWKRKRSRFEIGIRWVVLIVFLGPLIAYLGYRARNDVSILIPIVALLAEYLWMRRKLPGSNRTNGTRR